MLLALLVVLGVNPQAKETIRAIDAQEQLNDALEEDFNALCGALKAGRRDLSPQHAAKEVRFPLDGVVQVANCSLRALSIGKSANGELPVRFLWDLDGRTATGERVSVRNESDGAVKKEGKHWLVTRLEVGAPRRVVRPGPRFVERAQAAGLVLPARKTLNAPAEILSGGLSIRDVDADGVPDVLVIDGPQLLLYRGRAGLRYAAPEVVATAPKGKTLTDAALGDFDGDGDPDLVLTTYRNQPLRTFVNEEGHFEERTPVGKGGHHQTAIPSDLDGDGKLDLAVVSYPLENRAPSSYLQADNGEPPELWLGNGDLTFRPLPIPKKVARRHWSFSGVAADLLGTGRMQLYVINDYGVKDLYVLEADGGVSERSEEVGLTDPGPGMSLDVGDINRDGKLDVYVANMFSKAGTRIVNGLTEKDAAIKELMAKHVRGNTMFVAQPDGGFVDQAGELHVNRALWSFASLMSDVDNDSRLDVLVANGFMSAPIKKDR